MSHPEDIDLTPPEEFVDDPQELMRYLHENYGRIQRILQTPLFHNIVAATYTIEDDETGLNHHVVHINQAGVVTLNLPSTPRAGEIFICKDAIGDAGTFAKTIQVTGATGTVEGAANQQITVNNGWLLLYGYSGNYYKFG